jgi:hypothetical protein
MTHQEATYINMLILIVLAVSVCIQINLALWAISLIRELRTEVKAQVSDLVNLASQTGHAEGQLLGRKEGRDEIRALRAKEPGGPLSHTDDRGP